MKENIENENILFKFSFLIKYIKLTIITINLD